MADSGAGPITGMSGGVGVTPFRIIPQDQESLKKLSQQVANLAEEVNKLREENQKLLKENQSLQAQLEGVLGKTVYRPPVANRSAAKSQITPQATDYWDKINRRDHRNLLLFLRRNGFSIPKEDRKYDKETDYSQSLKKYQDLEGERRFWNETEKGFQSYVKSREYKTKYRNGTLNPSKDFEPNPLSQQAAKKAGLLEEWRKEMRRQILEASKDSARQAKVAETMIAEDARIHGVRFPYTKAPEPPTFDTANIPAARNVPRSNYRDQERVLRRRIGEATDAYYHARRGSKENLDLARREFHKAVQDMIDFKQGRK